MISKIKIKIIKKLYVPQTQGWKQWQLFEAKNLLPIRKGIRRIYRLKFGRIFRGIFQHQPS